MATTLSLIRKEQPKKPEETELQYLDRVRQDAFWKLNRKEKRTKDEEAEYKELTHKVGGLMLLTTSQHLEFYADEDNKPSIGRIFDELVGTFGMDTPQKKILIHRLCFVWNQALSYERMFRTTKYRTEGSNYTFDYSADKTRYLAEVRKGIESCNDQIIRLTQALQNLIAPPIQVKATNAFFAQNQQINQGKDAKDLETHRQANNKIADA